MGGNPFDAVGGWVSGEARSTQKYGILGPIAGERGAQDLYGGVGSVLQGAGGLFGGIGKGAGSPWMWLAIGVGGIAVIAVVVMR